VPGRVIAGVLVVAGGDGAPGLEAGEGVFDDDAAEVGGGVETLVVSLLDCCACTQLDLVDALPDDRADPHAAQHVTGRGVRVGLVRDDDVRAPAGSVPGRDGDFV
jgi:hypothetical protein